MTDKPPQIPQTPTHKIYTSLVTMNRETIISVEARTVEETERLFKFAKENHPT